MFLFSLAWNLSLEKISTDYIDSFEFISAPIIILLYSPSFLCQTTIIYFHLSTAIYFLLYDQLIHTECIFSCIPHALCQLNQFIFHFVMHLSVYPCGVRPQRIIHELDESVRVIFVTFIDSFAVLLLLSAGAPSLCTFLH